MDSYKSKTKNINNKKLLFHNISKYFFNIQYIFHLECALQFKEIKAKV